MENTMPTIEVMDLVTQYDDPNLPDRLCYYTDPDTFFPRIGERIISYLDAGLQPSGVLRDYYNALIMVGGSKTVREVLEITYSKAMRLPEPRARIRDGVLEILRLWFTEELFQYGGEKPIKLWIKANFESARKYKLVFG